MKYVSVMLLLENKKIEWIDIPWGKKYLDVIRKFGTIIMTVVKYQWKQ